MRICTSFTSRSKRLLFLMIAGVAALLAPFMSSAQSVTAVEYYNRSIDAFFLTARPAEQAAIDGIADFERTGMAFAATAGSAAQAANSICRFYISLATPYTSSHFYGLQSTDCALVQQVNPAGFTYEGIDFAVGLRSGATCPAATPVPVYRSFRPGTATRTANHRYTVSLTTYNRMASLGWTQEGIAFCVAAASDARATYPQSYVMGKNRFTTSVDTDIREYYVHVPAGYTGTQPRPVVFMLHGSGGNGEKFYGSSGWVETGEANNVITVFPSSWSYRCLIDDDGSRNVNAEKWNAYGITMCDSSDHERDDLKFLGQVIDDLRQRFNVDAKRVYMVGFSSGGEMAARTALDMSDRLAAVVTNAGGLGGFDVQKTPKRQSVPVTFQFGNSDDKMMRKIGATADLPMDIPLLFSTYPSMRSFINSFLLSFGMNPAYTISGTAQTALTASYVGTSGVPSNVFRMTIVKGLDHQYPNGINHPMKGADTHWAWMSAYTLP
jgi:poly(3-hydroxybutyrate) depolymerase